MPISTPLTARLGIRHPILLAPMDVIAGARLTAAVSAAGGFGILGGGYGDRAWLEQETAKLTDVSDPFGIGFITWSLASGRNCWTSRSRPATRDHAFVRRSKALRAAHQSVGRAVDLPGSNRGHGAAGTRRGRRYSDCAGHRGRRPRRIPHHPRYRAGDCRSRGRPRAGCGGGRHRRRPRAGGDDDAGRIRRAARHALLCQPGMRRRRGSQAADLRRVERQQRPRHHLRSLAQQCLAGAVYRPLPDQRSCAPLDRARGRTDAEHQSGRCRICRGEGGWKFRHRRRHCRRSCRADPRYSAGRRDR